MIVRIGTARCGVLKGRSSSWLRPTVNIRLSLGNTQSIEPEVPDPYAPVFANNVLNKGGKSFSSKFRRRSVKVLGLVLACLSAYFFRPQIAESSVSEAMVVTVLRLGCRQRLTFVTGDKPGRGGRGG